MRTLHSFEARGLELERQRANQEKGGLVRLSLPGTREEVKGTSQKHRKRMNCPQC